MKRLLLLSLLSISLIACKKEGNDGTGTGGYPTDGLRLEPETKSLLILGYAKGQPATASFSAVREVVSYSNKNTVNSISAVSGSGGIMYTNVSDSIYANFGSLAPASLVLNGHSVSDFLTMDEEVKEKRTEKPVMSIAHKVTSNDTAWVVDVKIKVERDTVSSRFFVETYMLADVPAKNYIDDGLDLRMAAFQGVIANSDAESFWDFSVPALDSSKQLINKGDPYIHKFILVSNFNKNRAFGTNMNDYNLFDYLYATGDVIGTRYTPIRHYFLKKVKPPYPFKARFISVIWHKDSLTNNYTHINSYADGGTY